MLTVKIALNPHWYSKFWIRQFFELARAGEIRLRPSLTHMNPATCFYFEVEGKPCLIDVGDHKEPGQNPANYFMYFKANYSPALTYSPNVRACLNGSTLTRRNVPLPDDEREYDLVWITGISGGRLHKVALFEALTELPLKMKLAARMVTPDDSRRWGPVLRALGVEVWASNLPYEAWLAWNQRARWCLLGRGKHDCLSFKMIDYMSIRTGVVVDYPPTSQWPVPLVPGENFISFDVSGPMGNDLTAADFLRLKEEYRRRVRALLPALQDDSLRRSVADHNYAYFQRYVGKAQAARDVLRVVQQGLHG